jgi:uncharacterized protein YpmS
MGQHSEFKQWKRKFLTFLSLKTTYFMPKLAILVSGVWLYEAAQNFAYAIMLLPVAREKNALTKRSGASL